MHGHSFESISQCVILLKSLLILNLLMYIDFLVKILIILLLSKGICTVLDLHDKGNCIGQVEGF